MSRLTLIEKYSWDRAAYRCECGAVTIANPHNVKHGKTRSCGCLGRESSRSVGIKNRRHGLSKSPEWTAWRNMRDRCYNPQHEYYPRYGGRGITVCPEWDSFERFLSDMGERPTPNHSLDRIRNDLGYSASNCRWATQTEQSQNREVTVWLTIDGEKIVLSQAARRFGVSRQTIQNRRRKGMTDDQAVGRETDRH